MTPTESFQSKHGAAWAAICNGPELTDALLTVNQSLLDEIVNLTPDRIASPAGNAILARLQGQLLHERALIDLSILETNLWGDLLESTYPDPSEEVERPAGTEREAPSSFPMFHDAHSQQPQQPESPKPKRKYRKRKRKN